jgi:hypothetical protein
VGVAWMRADDAQDAEIVPAHPLATPSARAQSRFAERSGGASRTIRSAYFFSSSL